MKHRLVRVGIYTLVALAFAGAIRFTPQLPEPDRKPAELLTQQAGTPSWKLRFDTLGRGESLIALLERAGLTGNDASLAIQSASMINPRRIPAGMPVTVKSAAADSAPSEVTLQLAIDRLIHLKRSGSTWQSSEERLPWTTDTVIVAGTIETNLYAAIDAAADGALPDDTRQELAWALADVYDYRVDMSRDLQKGDAFTVVAERQVAPSGAERIGKIVAATFTLSGHEIDAIHYTSGAVDGDYFDQTGHSMRTAFRRAPLDFRRISSVFGVREHPILGGKRMHEGIDYAAAYGTPVWAIGDGVVIREGWGNGYGNEIEIRHPNGFVTRYGHMSKFASGVHVGSRVSINQTIGYVGSTGLSTGPHLHFEVLVNGEARDPRIALNHVGGLPIPASEQQAFDAVRDRILSELGTPAEGFSRLAAQH